MSGSKINPTYFGYIGSTKDALLIIQACLNNQLYTVPRRPHDRERSSLIQSGNVFVFIEERSGIKRWTDGVAWSPSRILGRFLVYRELDRQALNNKDKDKKKLKKSNDDYESPLQSNSSSNNTSIPNRSLVGSLVTSYAFKEYGLIKKTLSLTVTRLDSINSQPIQETIHLVSYYSAEDVLNGKLQRPCDSNSNLSKIQLSNELWNAVKESSLGGKIPIEDEAYYFMDQSNPNAIALGFNPAIHLQPQYQQHNQQHHHQSSSSSNQQFNIPLPHPNSNNYSLPPPVPLQDQPQQQQPPPQAQPQPIDLQNMPMFYQYPRYSPSISYPQQQQIQQQQQAPPPQRRHTQHSPISPSSPQSQHQQPSQQLPPHLQYTQKDYSPLLKDVNYNTIPSSMGFNNSSLPQPQFQQPPPQQQQQVPQQPLQQPQILPQQSNSSMIGLHNPNNNGLSGKWFGYDDSTSNGGGVVPPPPPPATAAATNAGYAAGYQFNQNH
ncbi:unnamed protein product [Wickerhamomyces anomalus]